MESLDDLVNFFNEGSKIFDKVRSHPSPDYAMLAEAMQGITAYSVRIRAAAIHLPRADANRAKELVTGLNEMVSSIKYTMKGMWESKFA